MANSSQARKRARQAAKHRARNMSQRAAVRTFIKNFLKAIEAKDIEKSQETFRIACARIDRLTSKGLQHKNKSARLKSRMNARLKTLVQSSG